MPRHDPPAAPASRGPPTSLPGFSAPTTSVTFFVNASTTLSSTYTRSTDAQFWPAFIMAPQTMPLAARSRLASASTIAASLPPSSREHGMSFSAHACATLRPVATLPVKTTRSTSASHSAAPASPPPCTRPTTPSGTRPFSSSTTRSPDFGVTSLGLKTTALPASSAGTIVRSGSANGKFHGMMTATTPRGSRSIVPSLPG